MNTTLVRPESRDVSLEGNVLEMYLKGLGLPWENVMAQGEERGIVYDGFPNILKGLDEEALRNSRYLSKLLCAASIGLFDAALNYLWNEVVLKIRELVTNYGVDLFYNEALGTTKEKDFYQTEEDLHLIKDRVLLDTCRKLEIIPEIEIEKLIHILNMRNNIGASHPTKYSINSYELLGWVKFCVKDIISVSPSVSAIQVKKIMDCIKKEGAILTEDAISQFEISIQRMSRQLTDNLLRAMFSIYIDSRTSNESREKVLLLLNCVWNNSRDEVKYSLGEKISNFSRNLEIDKEHLGNAFFEKCNGKRYLAIEMRNYRLSSLIEDLDNKNGGLNNFHTEPAVIKEIVKYIESSKDILPQIEDKLLRVVLKARIGREVWYNKGVSPSAKPYYERIIKTFNEEQVIYVINLLSDKEIHLGKYDQIRIENLKEVLEIMKSNPYGERVLEMIEFILQSIGGNGSSIFNSSSWKELIIGY